MATLDFSQTLLFVLGKGGVGRTTCCLTLAKHFAKRGERVLIVQWAMQDSIAPRYGLPPIFHQETALEENIFAMNFDVAEAIREYFVDHLGLKLLHSVVIENKHVQRLIHAAPGIAELFFLGRLFWLVELAKDVRGWKYDRIIVDSPATGHGVSLFTVAQSVASFGMTGPLAAECERVATLLAKAEKVGVIICTLAEELPVEETLEFMPKITTELKRPPLFVVVNKSVSRNVNGNFPSVSHESWYTALSASLRQAAAKEAMELLLRDLLKRNSFEEKLLSACSTMNVPCLLLSDAQLTHPNIAEKNVPLVLSDELDELPTVGYFKS